MAGDLPDNIRLVRKAQRDLDALSAGDRRRIIEDIIRLARRTLPGEIKKIPALPGNPFQADAGRFRILHIWEGQTVIILSIFARAHQRDLFRAWRRNPPGI